MARNNSMKQFDKKGKRQREKNPDGLSSSLAINGLRQGQTLSSAKILKLAQGQLLQLNSQNDQDISSLANYVGAQSASQEKDMVLAILLQAAAERVANQQYVCVRKFLSICGLFSSKTGDSPIQRLAYYSAKALLEKIDRDCGLIFPSEDSEEEKKKPMDERLARLYLQPEMLEGQQENPFSLVCQFMAVRTIRECVASSKRVHLIDFSVDNGSHWTLIMQDLATRHDCPLELLTITAVGTAKQIMEETGKRLSTFAEAIRLPFSFNIVVSDMKELKKDMFNLQPNEVVAVHVATRLWTLLAWPNYLESLIGTIKSLNPRVMFVKEMEASTNKHGFMERFDEALILCSVWFDFGKDCMENQILYRKLTEEFCCEKVIRNIITGEGVQRVHRHEKIHFGGIFSGSLALWKELIPSSLYRAKIVD